MANVKKATSGRATPPKQPQEVSSVQTWKKSIYTDLKVPSGNVCRAKRTGMQVFVEQGLIPNALLPMVMAALDEGKAPSQRALQDVKLDPETISQMMALYDEVCIRSVVEPQVCPVPEDGKRSPDVLYVDEVDQQDKQFIFQWAVGGSADLERFRKEQTSLVESLQSGKNVGSKTKRSSKN